MARIQLQRSLLSATASTSTASTTSISISSVSSTLKLQPLMAKLQCRSMPNYPGAFLRNSLFGSGTECAKCSRISFKRGRISHRILSNGTMCAFTFQSKLGIFNSISPLNVFNGGFRDNYTALNLPIYGAFSKKLFSIAVVVRSKNASKNVMERRQGGKNVKVLAVHKKSRAANSSVLTSTNASVETLSEELVGKLKGGEELASSTSISSIRNSSSVSKVSEKKNPRSKKKNEESSSSDVVEEDSSIKGSKDVEAKKSKVKKSAKTKRQDLEKTSMADTSVELMNGSASTKRQSSKKSGNSSKTRKSVKKSDETLQKQKAEEVGKVNFVGRKPQIPLYPPSGRSVVVVESVTKAKVIQDYLGDMFEVLPSYGHVRDLAARSGSVRPDEDFSMVWEVPSAAWTHLTSIKVALRGAQNLILASDPDREGEAIAWHIIEMLLQQGALSDDMTVARVVFHEITEASIKVALQAPREIDVNLVHACLARRALDYLIGFNISPLLWRKLPGCQSAGRVQSAALSLICDREMEIDEFRPQEYWSVEVRIGRQDPGFSVNDFCLLAHLTHFGSKKLNQFSIATQAEAKEIEKSINLENFQVVNAKRTKIRKNPPMPYITSTLQQDAANKLHFSTSYTMKLAQKLYEGLQLSDGKAAGLITYIRTDGFHIADEAVRDIRSLVTQRYGVKFATESAPKYFKKVKNAQEAHEAIRPTDVHRLPSKLVGVLDEDSLKLYSLIWSRTIACQMAPSISEQIQVDIGNDCESIIFRSASSGVQFPGYHAVFEDSEANAIKHNENEGNGNDDKAFFILAALKAKDQLTLRKVELKQHHTQAPPRYSEGSLVKKLEELGIGRPSTYASTLKVLQDRNYVTVKSRVLYPEFRGRMVSAFLGHHFSEVTDYSFTADMETELDNVSAGLTEWKGLLRDYWTRFNSYCERTSSVHIHQVEKMLETKFEDFLFSFLPDKNRTCPSCMEGTLIFKVSRFGAGYFIGCDQHPKCNYIAKTLYGEDEEEDAPPKNYKEPKLLGLNPGSNEKILLKSGPYGFYVQLGEDRKGYLPKRASLFQMKDVDSITLEDAIQLLKYPVTLGNHPKDGQPVDLKISKGGFSIRHRRIIAPVPKNLKPNEITLEKALELLLGKDVKRSGRPKSKPKIEEAIESI